MATSHVLYKPGQDLTVKAGAALVGGRFIKLNSAKVDGANLAVVYAGAGDVPLGVTGQDIADGEIGHAHGRGLICEVESSATIAANVNVKIAANGRLAAAAVGEPVVGRTMTGGDENDLLLVDVFANPAIIAPAANWPN